MFLFDLFGEPESAFKFVSKSFTFLMCTVIKLIKIQSCLILLANCILIIDIVCNFSFTDVLCSGNCTIIRFVNAAECVLLNASVRNVVIYDCDCATFHFSNASITCCSNRLGIHTDMRILHSHITIYFELLFAYKLSFIAYHFRHITIFIYLFHLL